MLIGERLRAIREAKKLSQGNLEHRLARAQAELICPEKDGHPGTFSAEFRCGFETQGRTHQATGG